MEHISQEGNFKINSEIIIEAVELLKEYLLYGENRDNNILELFCEYNFLDALKTFIFGNKEIIIISQIVKTLSTLIKNISEKTVFYYLMSNNFINNIISRNFSFLKQDKNFILVYIDLLEVLALKLNISILQFLFQEEKGRFPLLDISIKFYNYPDYNIRKRAKQIILNIIKIDYKPLHKYLTSLPAISFFCFLSCQLKDEVINLSNEIQKNKNNINDKNEQVKILINVIIDNIKYIQDIFDINFQKINYVMINTLFYYCIIPYILYNMNCDKEKAKKSGKRIKKNICILFINMLFMYIKNDVFLNILFALIFFPSKSNTIKYYMENKPIQPINYYYNWNQSLKNSSNSFLNYMQFNFNRSFLKSILYMNKSKYTEIQQIYNKFQEKSNNESNYDFEKDKDIILKDITREILNKLTCSEISLMSSYHSYLSVATGINCGISTKNRELCVIKKMEKFLKKYFSKNEEDKLELIRNDINQNLFQILNKKKSNKKIFLINILLKNIFDKSPNIAKLLLKEVNIIPGNLLNDEEISYINNINKEKEKILKYQNKNPSKEFYRNNIDNDQNLSPLSTKENDYNHNKTNQENKENCDPNIDNKQNYEKDIYKNSKIVNTLISLNGFLNNSRYSIAEPIKNIMNIDNHCLEEGKHIIRQNSNEDVESPLTSQKSYSLLSLDYFNNFKNEVTSSDDSYYNETLVDKLILLLERKGNVGILSLKLIVDIILILLTKESRSFISLDHINKIYSVYETYKNEIISNYNNKKSFHNNAYQLFIKQYDNYLLLSDFDYTNNIMKVEYMIKYNSSGNDFLFHNNINQNNKYDTLILSFLIIHDLYYHLLSLDNSIINMHFSNNSNKTIYINIFPLLNQTVPLKLNKQYYLINLEPNINYYECKCKIILNKVNNNQNFFDAFLLILDNFIFIGDSSVDRSYTIIKYKFLISNCSIQSDEYNNKNINIYINNNIYDDNEIEIFRDFKDYNTSKNIISLLKKEIKRAKFFEKDKIKKFIQSF